MAGALSDAAVSLLVCPSVRLFVASRLDVTRTYSTFGNRAFAAAGPGLCNSFPSHLKEADLSCNRFRRLLNC